MKRQRLAYPSTPRPPSTERDFSNFNPISILLASTYMNAIARCGGIFEQFMNAIAHRQVRGACVGEVGGRSSEGGRGDRGHLIMTND